MMRYRAELARYEPPAHLKSSTGGGHFDRLESTELNYKSDKFVGKGT